MVSKEWGKRQCKGTYLNHLHVVDDEGVGLLSVGLNNGGVLAEGHGGEDSGNDRSVVGAAKTSRHRQRPALYY